MLKNIQKFGAVFAFVPLFAVPATEINIAPNTSLVANDAGASVEEIREERAAKIEKYYSDRSMPLEDKAMKFVLEAEKYGLDWRLLPAIAVRESSGGKNACYNNPFGWGSCKIKFGSYDEAIEMLAKNLGGANKKTSYYYAGKTTEEKLYYYNGTVVPTYPKEVLAIMDRLDKVDLD
jgi:hypothetical protein